MRGLRAAAALGLCTILALPALAADPAPGVAAVPARTRPVVEAPRLAAVPAKARTDAAAPVAKAQAEPARLAAVGAYLRPLPRPDAVATRGPERVQRAAFVAPLPDALATRKGGALCGIPGLQGERIAPVTSRVKGCGIADAVKVTAVDGIPLSMPATIDCTTAAALDRWVKTGLKRAVGGQGGGLARIEIAGSYTCRPMNNVSGNKISEHGRGKAIDISGIVLKDGTRATILRDWKRTDTGPMLRAAYRAACGIFGTTLGPGSDGYHEDHLHFDTASHRRGAYCR